MSEGGLELGTFCHENDSLTARSQLLYKARNLVNSHFLKQLYFSYIHSYLTYANITWGSTHKSNLMGLYRQQKYAARIIYYKDKLTRQTALKKLNALDAYELN